MDRAEEALVVAANISSSAKEAADEAEKDEALAEDASNDASEARARAGSATAREATANAKAACSAAKARALADLAQKAKAAVDDATDATRKSADAKGAEEAEKSKADAATPSQVTPAASWIEGKTWGGGSASTFQTSPVGLGETFTSPTGFSCFWRMDSKCDYYELVDVRGMVGWYGFHDAPPRLAISASVPRWVKTSKRWGISAWDTS